MKDDGQISFIDKFIDWLPRRLVEFPGGERGIEFNGYEIEFINGAGQFRDHAFWHRGRNISKGHESIRVLGDETGSQVVACCPIGMEDLKKTGQVNPGLIHGMQHLDGVVDHPDCILPPDVSVEVNHFDSVNHGFPLFVKCVLCCRHR